MGTGTSARELRIGPLDSALSFLRPVDYYRGDPEALPAELMGEHAALKNYGGKVDWTACSHNCCIRRHL